MKLTITKKWLAGALKTVSVAASKSTMQILTCVRLSVTSKQSILELACTDLDVWVQRTAVADVSEAGSVCVRVSLLRAIVEDVAHDDDQISLDANGEIVKVSTPTGTYFLASLPGEEFPPLPKVKGEKFQLNAAKFYSLFYSTSAAVSEDESRYVLNGCDMILADHVTVVATDGRRLMKMSFEPDEKPKSLQGIVPAKAVSQLLRLVTASDEPVMGVLGENQVEFRFDGVVLVTKLIDGNYPNFEQVIPQHSKRLIIPRKELLEALTRVSRVGNVCTFRLSKNCLRIEGKQEKGSTDLAEESLAVLNAEKLTIRFQFKYLADALSAVGDPEVALEFGTALEPLLVRSTVHDWLAVIMPMRFGDEEKAVVETPAEVKEAPKAAEKTDCDEDEDLINQCIEVIRSEQKAGVSLLQRRLRLGYARASALMDELEKRGVVGPAKPDGGLRDILLEGLKA